MKTGYRSLIGIVLLAILLVPPTRILLHHYSADSGFLGLIYFGKAFKEKVLPDVQKISPVTKSWWGYDGQYYAQIALRPALSDDALARALDNPIYRSRRIGLPFLAYCLGIGNSYWILQIYALLNFVFWLLLTATIIRFIGYNNFKDLSLAIALLWSSGTLTSVARSLTDFPAVVLGVLAIFSSSKWRIAAILFGTSAMVKETSALSFAALPWRNKYRKMEVKRAVISSFIMVLPITLWFIYVHVQMPSGSVAGAHNFSQPLSGITHKLYDAALGFTAGLAGASAHRQTALFFEVLCPLSLVIQAIYLVAKPRAGSAAWRFGIGFVILLSILGKSVWVEQYAYCRVLLPLTFSFNLLIHQHESGARFGTWYLFGNAGMFWVASGWLF